MISIIFKNFGKNNKNLIKIEIKEEKFK